MTTTQPVEITSMPPLTWVAALPGWQWRLDINGQPVETEPWCLRSGNGEYVIVLVMLPEQRSSGEHIRFVYLLRHVDQATRQVDPRAAGYLVAELDDLDAAKRRAEHHRAEWALRAQRDVPADYPALIKTRFYWPISDGTSKGALALVDRGDAVDVQVVEMVRQGNGYKPSAGLAQFRIRGEASASPTKAADHAYLRRTASVAVLIMTAGIITIATSRWWGPPTADPFVLTWVAGSLTFTGVVTSLALGVARLWNAGRQRWELATRWKVFDPAQEDRDAAE